MKNILIIGAGAIGRGYLPWLFDLSKSALHFIDKSEEIFNQMNQNRKFTIYQVVNGHLEALVVPVAAAWTPELFLLDPKASQQKYEAVFVNVGPRAVVQIAPLLKNISAPVILCENDPSSVHTLQTLLPFNQKIVFAVPDVITSNTAPIEFLAKDPLTVITEKGEIFIDEKVSNLEGDFRFISENELLHKQWTAKLYIHNTPHCIAAYMGALVGVDYVHEAMAIPEVETIVEGSMEEMLMALKSMWDIPHDFLDWYAAKELSRFRCKQLYDPISRVAREPLRKLELDGRLIGAAQICLSLGFVPHHILLGITSALLFDNPNDTDHHLGFMQRALGTSTFLTHVLGLRKGEALERVLSTEMHILIKKLNSLIDPQAKNSKELAQ